MSPISLDRWDGLSGRARRSLLAEYGVWIMLPVYILLESILDIDRPEESLIPALMLIFSLSELAPGRGWRLWAALIILPSMAMALLTTGLAAFTWIVGVERPGDAEIALGWFLFLAVATGPGMALGIITELLLRESPGTEADRLAAANAYALSGRYVKGGAP